ncbi:hypothetical protein NXH58_13345, partial [Agathobacter ruminis]|uniref:hypothetical protein n=1 Tax=Agathobacter ruminis TaxID=1712665 RepID=UPI00234DA79D
TSRHGRRREPMASRMDALRRYRVLKSGFVVLLSKWTVFRTGLYGQESNLKHFKVFAMKRQFVEVQNR